MSPMKSRSGGEKVVSTSEQAEGAMSRANAPPARAALLAGFWFVSAVALVSTLLWLRTWAPKAPSAEDACEGVAWTGLRDRTAAGLRLLCQLNNHLLAHGIQEHRVYGNIASSSTDKTGVMLEQLTYYAQELPTVLGRPAESVQRICEIGFAGGHSALVFLASYPNAEYLAFDQWDRHWYQNLGLEFVRRAFPDRAVTVVKGDSTVTVPQYFSSHPHLRCDVVSVDGAHHSFFPLHDLYNMAVYSYKDSHVLLADDCSPSWPAVDDAWKVWKRLGMITERSRQLTSHFHRGTKKGWCVGSYNSELVGELQACATACARTQPRLMEDHTGAQFYWPASDGGAANASQMRRGVQPLAGALARHTQGYEIQHAAIKCTVLILVYKRVAHLLRSLHHYAGLTAAAEILLVWNNREQAPGPRLERFVAAHNNVTESATIRIFSPETNSLNNRYFVHDKLTTEAVVFVDDDVLYDLEHLRDALEVWRVADHRLVGFFARSYRQDNVSGMYEYVCGVSAARSYSLVIGKGLIVHRSYLREYSKPENRDLHSIVDETNCDDLALNFLVANLSHTSPIHHPIQYVELPPVKSYLGLSASSNWIKNGAGVRTLALNKLVTYFDRIPLVESTISTFTANRKFGQVSCWAPSLKTVTC